MAGLLQCLQMRLSFMPAQCYLRNVTILINDCGRAEFSECALADILQRFLTVRYPAAAICC